MANYADILRGSMNPYTEEEKRLMAQARAAQANNPYGLNAIQQQERNYDPTMDQEYIKRQQRMADVLRSDMPETIQGNSRIQVANPYNAIAKAAMMGLAGLSEGRARKRSEEMEPKMQAKAAAEAAVEEAKYRTERGDVAFGQNMQTRKQDYTEMSGDRDFNLRESAQEYAEMSGDRNWDLNSKRFGLEKSRFGLDESRFGLEQEKFAESVEQADRAEERELEKMGMQARRLALQEKAQNFAMNQDREYIHLADADGKPLTIRQGDEVPEGAMLMSDYIDMAGSSDSGPAGSYTDPVALENLGLPANMASSITKLPSATERGKAVLTATSAATINDVLPQVYQAVQKGINFTGGGWKGVGTQVAGAVGGILGEDAELTAQQMAKEGLYSDEELHLRSLVDRAVEGYRRAETGANLTGIERKLGANWNPAEAPTAEQAMARLIELQKFMNTQLTVQGLPQVRNWTPPESEGEAQPAGIGSMSEEDFLKLSPEEQDAILARGR